MAAGAGRGVGRSESSAGFEGAGSADKLVSSTAAVVGEGSDFRAVVSCGSLLRSVFDEPGGLDFAILERALGYIVACKRNSRRIVAKAKILSCDSCGPHLPIAHGRRVDLGPSRSPAQRGEKERQRRDRGDSSPMGNRALRVALGVGPPPSRPLASAP